MSISLKEKINICTDTNVTATGVVAAIPVPAGVNRFAVKVTATKTSGTLDSLKLFTSLAADSVAAGSALELEEFGTSIAATTTYLKFDVDLDDPNAALLPYLIVSTTITTGDYDITADIYVDV